VILGSSKSIVKLNLNKVCSVCYCWKHLSEVLNSDLLCSIVRLAKKLTSVDEQVSCDQVYLSKVPPFDLFCGFVLVLIFAVVSIRWVMAWYWISSSVCLICLRMLIGYSGLSFLYACSADVLSTWWYTYLHRTLLGVMAACPCHSWWGWWSGTLWVTQGHDWTHFYSVYFVTLNFFVEFPYIHTDNNKYSVTDCCPDWKGSTTVWNRRLWHCSTEDVHKFVNGFLQFFLVHLAGYTKTFQQLIKLLDPSVTKCTCSFAWLFQKETVLTEIVRWQITHMKLLYHRSTSFCEQSLVPLTSEKWWHSVATVKSCANFSR